MGHGGFDHALVDACQYRLGVDVSRPAGDGLSCGSVCMLLLWAGFGLGEEDL